MSEMVERVVRVISDNIQAGLPDGVTVNYEYAARAAIGAMLEPTNEMYKSVVPYPGSFGENAQEDTVAVRLCIRMAWQTMIEGALGQKQL